MSDGNLYYETQTAEARTIEPDYDAKQYEIIKPESAPAYTITSLDSTYQLLCFEHETTSG